MENHNEIKYNYHKYSSNNVYITMGINVGIGTRYFLIDNEKIFENNFAFPNIFSNYLKNIFGKKYIIDVDRTVFTLSYLSHTETMGDDIVTFINDICDLKINNEVFEKVKKITIDNLKKVYKDGVFRGWYKSFEIADLNKGFSFKQLISDLKNITYEEFVDSYNYLINLYNSAIYVNGEIRDLTAEEMNKIKQIFNQKKNYAILGGKICNPYLRGDAHLLEIARESANIDILAFSFSDTVSVFDRMIYLDIETAKIPYQDKMIHVDEFDASIIINEGELMKLKNIFKKLVSEEQFLSNQTTLLRHYSNWLEKNPERFGKWCVELVLDGIAPIEYLNVLSRISYSEYKDVAERIRPIITEAQIVMRR